MVAFGHMVRLGNMGSMDHGGYGGYSHCGRYTPVGIDNLVVVVVVVAVVVVANLRGPLVDWNKHHGSRMMMMRVWMHHQAMMDRDDKWWGVY